MTTSSRAKTRILTIRCTGNEIVSPRVHGARTAIQKRPSFVQSPKRVSLRCRRRTLGDSVCAPEPGTQRGEPVVAVAHPLPLDAFADQKCVAVLVRAPATGLLYRPNARTQKDSPSFQAFRPFVFLRSKTSHRAFWSPARPAWLILSKLEEALSTTEHYNRRNIRICEAGRGRSSPDRVDLGRPSGDLS